MRYLKEFLCAAAMFFIAALPAVSNAQDPAQYGTPFTGVPDIRDVNMYQVNIRPFSPTSDLPGVIARLDSIKALGINVLYLMPVYPVGVLMSVNSPYCISNLEAVGSEYGSLTDLRSLVTTAHSLGMAVIMDFVANQTSWDHPWITEHPGWYLHDHSGAIAALGTYTDVAALNFSNDSVVKALDSVMRFWIFTANIDGFRCDFADNPPLSFWSTVIANIRGITTHKLIMLAEGVRSGNYGAGFDYNFGYQSYDNSFKPIFSSSANVTDIDNSNTVEYSGSSGNQQVVRFLTNHDVNSSDGTPLELFGGASGSMALFVVAVYMKGVPFIYDGQEVDFPTQIIFPFTSVTIDWTGSYAAEAEYTKLLSFRNSCPAIRRGALTSYDNDNVCAFTKAYDSQTVAVFSNLRNSNQTLSLPTALKDKTYYDAFTGNAVALGTSVSLSAYQYMVLTSTKSDLSVAGITNSASVLLAPNPATGNEFSVVFNNLPQGETATVTVRDETGQTMLKKQLRSSGEISHHLSAGLYFVTISAPSLNVTQKLLIQ